MQHPGPPLPDRRRDWRPVGWIPWVGVQILFAILLLLAGEAWADAGLDWPRIVPDDRGHRLPLEQPAQRIISLAPHLTEMLFSIGAGARLVGTVAHSDYPDAAALVPRIGSATRLDLERILEARPDLVLVWSSGNPRSWTETLERHGLRIYFNEPEHFADIATTLRRLGQLTGLEEQAERIARDFEAELARLRQEYRERAPVRLFYQVWDQPLMTLNDRHWVAEALALCGGENVFGTQDSLVPRLNLEAVLAEDPEAIVTGGPAEQDPRWLEPWRRWTQLTAVQRDNLFFIPPSWIQRATPRLTLGVEQLCWMLDTVRTKRP